MGFEVLVNGNAMKSIGLTIPSGKEACFYFNFTPNTNGTYNVTAIADPAKLYPIIDRSKNCFYHSYKCKGTTGIRSLCSISPNGLIYLKEANLTSTGALLVYVF